VPVAVFFDIVALAVLKPFIKQLLILKSSIGPVGAHDPLAGATDSSLRNESFSLASLPQDRLKGPRFAGESLDADTR
jgi:hypothetical protein